jgi:hypothetical protein
MQEKKIRCELCKREFLIGLSEKQYLTVMGFTEPTICQSCQEKDTTWNPFPSSGGAVFGLWSQHDLFAFPNAKTAEALARDSLKAAEDELDKERLKNPTALYFCGECVFLLQYLGYFLVQEDSPLYDIIPDSAFRYLIGA